MVALFAGAVGVGVHVLNKEARAWTNHVVWVFDTEDNPRPVISVTISVKTGINPEVWSDLNDVTDATGKIAFNISANTTATFWKAQVTDWNNWAPRLDIQDNPAVIDYPTQSVTFIVEA